MKSIMYSMLLLLSISAAATVKNPEVSEKVLLSFKQTFANAKNVKWSSTKTRAEVSFSVKEVNVKAYYDQDGNLLQTTRYYKESNLPSNILSKIKKGYPGREIFGITEISDENNISYHITLRDAKSWYIVQSDPYGNYEQLNKFKDATHK